MIGSKRSDRFAEQGELIEPDWGHSKPDRFSSGFVWMPTRSTEGPDPAELENQLLAATPDNQQLLEWARRPESQPPQTWWNEKTNPFQSDES